MPVHPTRILFTGEETTRQQSQRYGAIDHNLPESLHQAATIGVHSSQHDQIELLT